MIDFGCQIGSVIQQGTTTSEARSRRAASVYACSQVYLWKRSADPSVETLSSLVALHHIMAKRRPRRKFNLRKARIATSDSIGALASLDVIEFGITDLALSPMRVISADLAFALTDLAALIDDGQEFGIAHSDYSAAEIEECLESTGQWNLSDKVSVERANRLVRTLGFFDGAPGTDGSKSHNNGKPVHIKLNWPIGVGMGIVIWVRNGSDTVYTTGTNIAVNGHFWIKDSY